MFGRTNTRGTPVVVLTTDIKNLENADEKAAQLPG
jgi:hypothetical protein